MKNREQVQERSTAPAGRTTNGDGDIGRTTDRRVYTPPTDILDKNDEYVLTVDMPGAEQQTLDVTFDDNVLTIRASTRAHEFEGFTLAHAEFEFGDYERAFEVSERVNADAIQAEFKNGVLTVHLPKQKPSRKKVSVATT